MTRLFYVPAAWLLAGCGAAAKAPAVETADDAAAEAYMESEATPYEGGMAADDSIEANYVQKEMAMPISAAQGSVTTARPPRSPSAPPQKAQPEPEPKSNPTTPMVIYSGYLQLRVKQLLTAIDEITQMVESWGGYIDSLTRNVMVVRIPGKDFEKAMKAISSAGHLLNRRVQAQDVTAQFTDLLLRQNVAKEARERLLILLAKEKKPQERLRILQEIKRLSEQIDTIESRLAAIRNLVDFFTITIELEPILAVERVDTGLSPFAWVRDLKPHLATQFEGKKDFNITLPNEFVLFDDDDAYRAQAADTTTIRAAKIENEPRGDNAFWIDAIDFEMTSRQETIKEKGTAGSLLYRLYENDDVTPRYYLVGVQVIEDNIYLVEVFFPNTESFERHHDAVLETLKTIEVAK